MTPASTPIPVSSKYSVSELKLLPAAHMDELGWTAAAGDAECELPGAEALVRPVQQPGVQSDSFPLQPGEEPEISGRHLRILLTYKLKH